MLFLWLPFCSLHPPPLREGTEVLGPQSVAQCGDGLPRLEPTLGGHRTGSRRVPSSPPFSLTSSPFTQGSLSLVRQWRASVSWFITSCCLKLAPQQIPTLSEAFTLDGPLPQHIFSLELGYFLIYRPFIRKDTEEFTPPPFLSTMGGHGKNVAICRPQRTPSPETELACSMIPVFQPP